MIDFPRALTAHAHRLAALGVTTGQRARLARYLDRVWEQNHTLNLVSRKMSAEALVNDHLMDSLIALPHLPAVETVADLGTGGGFPAVPLEICRPATRFLLFEKSPRKCNFLQSLAAWIPNLSIVGPLLPDSLQKVDLVLARAFKPIPVILEMTRAFYARGGRYLLYKGRLPKIREELDQARLPSDTWQIVALEPPEGIDERHLVLIHVYSE